MLQKTHTLDGLMVMSLRENYDSANNIMASTEKLNFLLSKCTSSDRFAFALLALRAHPASADPLPFSLVLKKAARP